MCARNVFLILVNQLNLYQINCQNHLVILKIDTYQYICLFEWYVVFLLSNKYSMLGSSNSYYLGM